MRFDAYHKWLGIQPAEQPPNHYRLLAISLFEDDPDVIETAADQRMSLLRTFQTGPHSARSQELLNELARAKLCLLDKQWKLAYDVDLRRQFTASNPVQPASVVAVAPPAMTLPQPTPPATQPLVPVVVRPVMAPGPRFEPPPLIVTAADRKAQMADVDRRGLSSAAFAWLALAAVAIPAAIFVGYLIWTKPKPEPAAPRPGEMESVKTTKPEPEQPAPPPLNEPTPEEPISLKRRPSELPEPIARWDFSRGLGDEIGGLACNLHGGAKLAEGRLQLPGGDAFASTPLKRTLTTKTLEAWVALANLDQRSGSAMCVQTLDGQQFDAIVYAEHQPRRWMAGSDWGRRTVDVAGPLEETADGKLIHVAVVYRGDGEISVYRNGQRYGEPYRTKALQPFEGGKAEILFGPRCHPGTTCLAGSIARAQLYDVALSSEQIAVLATDAPPTGPPRRADPSTPKPRSLAGLTNQNDPPPPAKSGNKPRFPSEMRGGTGGDWAIEGDELVRRPDLPESTILFGDPAWTEYDFSFDAKVRKGWSAWFFFGYQDEKNFHWYGIGAWDNTWELVVTVEGGKWGKRQCERRVAIPGDIWQQIRISVRGKKGRCFRNGESVGEFSMPHLLKGRLGFVVEKKASYRFRNIMVKSPSGKVLLKGLPDVGEASAPDDREAGTDKPRSLGDLVTDAKANSQQLTTTEAFSLKRHEAAVTRLAFHRTQPLLASAGKDGCVLLWSLQTRAPLELHKFREEAWAIKFSPDGAMLAFANRNWWGSRLLFKTLAGQQLNEIKDFKNGGGAVASIAYSPDGRLFAAGQDDGTIRLWDVIQFREIPPVALGEGHNIYGLAFGTYTVDRKSKRAEYLLAAGGPDRMVRTLKATLDNKNGGQWTFWQTKVQFPTPGPVIGVRFSPNGTLLGTTRLGGRVSLYNPNTGESVRELAAGVRNNPAEWIAFHPQRPWCVTAHKNEQVARIWNTDTAELLCELKGHAGGVMCAEFSPDGRHVATASEDLSIKLWNLAGKDVPAAPTRAKNTKPAVPIVGD